MSIRVGVGAAVLDSAMKRWPCAAIPHGGLTELGREFGVSRERIRQILNKQGIYVDETLNKKNKETKFCAGGCGKAWNGKTDFCLSCRKVSIPCGCGCGEMVIRSAASLTWRNGRSTTKGKTYQGRVFVNRAHFGKWCATNYGWGSKYQEDAGSIQKRIESGRKTRKQKQVPQQSLF